jgi:peptidoglycan/xylan/chitin deacetylase (PgdA/CDA1 family)
VELQQSRLRNADRYLSHNAGFDAFGLRATAAVNSAIATRYPRLIDELAQHKWEFVTNGVDMGRVHHGGLTLEDERELIRNAQETMAHAVSTPVKGWHSPGRSQPDALRPNPCIRPNGGFTHHRRQGRRRPVSALTSTVDGPDYGLAAMVLQKLLHLKVVPRNASAVRSVAFASGRGRDEIRWNVPVGFRLALRNTIASAWEEFVVRRFGRRRTILVARRR